MALIRPLATAFLQRGSLMWSPSKLLPLPIVRATPLRSCLSVANAGSTFGACGLGGLGTNDTNDFLSGIGNFGLPVLGQVPIMPHFPARAVAAPAMPPAQQAQADIRALNNFNQFIAEIPSAGAPLAADAPAPPPDFIHGQQFDVARLYEAPAVGNTRPHRKYQSAFILFMEFVMGCPINPQQTFPPNFLKQIKPHHVKDYLTKRAFGRVDADLDRDEPKEHRSSTLEGDKRAISHYMPLNIPWDGTKGNPTRDRSVNNVINKVKVMECLGRGLPSQAVREFEDCEFVGIIDILRGFGDFVKSILTVTMMVLQLHICV